MMTRAQRSLASLVLLALTIWGAVHPLMHFIAWFDTHGYELGPMIDAWYVNSATEGLVWDLTIAAVVLTVWALWSMITASWWFLLVIPATYCIGVSCGLPLMLLLWVRLKEVN